jgi:hypothetical protein
MLVVAVVVRDQVGRLRPRLVDGEGQEAYGPLDGGIGPAVGAPAAPTPGFRIA